MLHSTYHHKETNEDPKTSAVFENLMLLPDNVFWHLMRQSCFSNTDMPITSGRLLSYDFWPHWDRTGTDNTNYVEPDLFIRFEEFDVIIEAKYGEIDKLILKYCYRMNLLGEDLRKKREVHSYKGVPPY